MAVERHRVGQASDVGDIVGDEDHRDLRSFMDRAQLFTQVIAYERVDRREGFVEKNEIRTGCEGARERHALLLSAGELAWMPFRKAGGPTISTTLQRAFDP